MQANNKGFAVAIDGPGGAGKSSVAKQIAKQTQMMYIDTGAMYRAVALYGLQNGMDLYDETAIAASLSDMDMHIEYSEDKQRLWLNGEDVTDSVRTQSAAEGASIVAGYPAVRKHLIALQREWAQGHPVVMDGRDIGSHVLPQAQLKIYLDASLDERTRRRVQELTEKGMSCDPAFIKQQIAERDLRDTSRKVSPLVQAEDAVYMDTSDLSFWQVVGQITQLIEQRINK